MIDFVYEANASFFEMAGLAFNLGFFVFMILLGLFSLVFFGYSLYRLVKFIVVWFSCKFFKQGCAGK